MGKPFYEFDKQTLRDGLWVEYIIPVANWFLNCSERNGCLLPEKSGSIWECSLAMDFLLKVYTSNPPQTLTESDCIKLEKVKEVIPTKSVSTAKWLTSALREEDLNDNKSKGRSWESAPWDTAVALRSVIRCFDSFGESFTESEKTSFKQKAADIIIWLIDQSANYKSSDGYMTADPTDLAVALSAILTIYDNDNIIFDEKELEKSAQKIVEKLLKEAKETKDNTQAKFDVSQWGSVANVGEVICALTDFCKSKKIAQISDFSQNVNDSREAILEGLQHIESTLEHGNNLEKTSVSDNCGILWSYLYASEVFPDTTKLKHDDIMVFKLLTWLCDQNKVLLDGSFLHSSYVTVFYALSLIEAYNTWKLAEKQTNHVYNEVVWLNPNIKVSERAERLNLELENENLRKQIEKNNMRHKEETQKLEEIITDVKKVRKVWLIISGIALLSFCILLISGALQLSLLNIDLFLQELSIALTIIIAVVPVIKPILTKHYEEALKKEKESDKTETQEIKDTIALIKKANVICIICAAIGTLVIIGCILITVAHI